MPKKETSAARQAKPNRNVPKKEQRIARAKLLSLTQWRSKQSVIRLIASNIVGAPAP